MRLAARLTAGAILLALIVGYVELRMPVSVGAQGGDAVYRSLRVETPIEPRYLGTGTPAIWTYLRGDGVWAGVSPPTVTSSTGIQIITNSVTYQDTALTFTLDLPTPTSDVLINVRSYQTHACVGQIWSGTTSLQSGQASTEFLGPLEYTAVHHNPGIGTQTYVYRIRREFGGSSPCGMNNINSLHGGLSTMIGQVLR